LTTDIKITDMFSMNLTLDEVNGRIVDLHFLERVPVFVTDGYGLPLRISSDSVAPAAEQFMRQNESDLI
jgi:hypothetical protein